MSIILAGSSGKVLHPSIAFSLEEKFILEIILLFLSRKLRETFEGSENVQEIL
ncbi:MAG: hypothetical protein ACP5KE_09055 [Candidatus Methanodesulfokora sp.]